MNRHPDQVLRQARGIVLVRLLLADGLIQPDGWPDLGRMLRLAQRDVGWANDLAELFDEAMLALSLSILEAKGGPIA